MIDCLIICIYYSNVPGIVGGVIGFIIFVGIIAAIVSCCCCACCPYYRGSRGTVITTSTTPITVTTGKKSLQKDFPQLSRLMTKPTKWLCTQRMPRLIWVFAERTVILLVLSCRGSFSSIPFLIYQFYMYMYSTISIFINQNVQLKEIIICFMIYAGNL